MKKQGSYRDILANAGITDDTDLKNARGQAHVLTDWFAVSRKKKTLDEGADSIYGNVASAATTRQVNLNKTAENVEREANKVLQHNTQGNRDNYLAAK